MITRIEIDGFKTFQDFAVDLAPFQVIIGANGCGKSNFFDALDLLSKLASSDLRTAFKGIRGNINELFTILPGNKSADKMRFAVEMLVEVTSQNVSEEQSERQFSRMRYEIQIQQTAADGFEQLYVYEERLVSISAQDDAWIQAHFPENEQRSVERVDTEWIVTKHESGPTYNGGIDFAHFTLDKIVFYSNDIGRKLAFADRPLISMYLEISSPHLLAAQSELRTLRLLQLDATYLRLPSDFFDERTITATGKNLPATLARMQTQDKHLLKDVSRDVLNIVPSFTGIEVDRDEGRKQIALYATMRDKRRLSIDALSEGTLRILALATLRHDPQLQGTLCLEDPEIGVHPAALKRIVKMLRGMATNFNDPEDLNMPLRQVLVTTHSPELVSELNIEGGELLFATMATRIVPGSASWQVTRLIPVCSDSAKGADRVYALGNVIQYLSNSDVAAKRDNLREVFAR